MTKTNEGVSAELGGATPRVAEDYRVCRDHGLFDDEWYTTQYGDVAAAGVDPLVHYLEYGAIEGRDPHPLFDSDWYLAQYPDVAAAAINPLVHYLEYGASEGRDPSPGFDTDFYLWQYPDVARSGANPLIDFVTDGEKKGRLPRAPASGRSVSALPPVRHERWSVPSGDEWAASFTRRLKARMKALKTMELGKPFADGRPTFSLITAVFNTKPEFLDSLAQSIREQAFTDFEWLIVDNGSKAPSTVAMLQEITAKDNRIRLFREEKNLHIVGGSRFLLDRAVGHFIVPVDHDDLLYPDSLALFANVLRDNREALPCLIYSDEQKITEGGEPSELIWRWDFTLSHAMATTPAAHLIAFSTDQARQADVYGDDYARGSPDWDAIIRITERGGAVVHIPEVLYGWRIHEKSTARATSAKDYINKSQSDVLTNALKRQGLNEIFSLDLPPGMSGWFHPVRKQCDMPEIEIDFVLGMPHEELKNLRQNLAATASVPARRRLLFPAYRAAEIRGLETLLAECACELIPCNSEEELVTHINRCAPGAFAKVILASSLRVQAATVIWDAIGLLQLDRKTGVVCGPVVGTNGRVLNIGMLNDVAGFVGSPLYGWENHEVPHFFKITHAVTVAPTFFVAIRGEMFRQEPLLTGIDTDDAIHGLGLAQHCVKSGYAISYSPNMACERATMLARSVAEGTVFRAQARNGSLVAKLPQIQLSSHLSREQNRFGLLDNLHIQVAQGSYAQVSPAIPLNIGLDPDLEDLPTINLLLPAVRMSSMSGGPNTALNVCCKLAEAGYALRIISTDHPLEDTAAVLGHMKRISGVPVDTLPIEFVDGSDRTREILIGANDIFMATAWWTAQMAKHASRAVGRRPFLYMIQDFEPLLYAASSRYALALETYELDHIPIINTRILKNYLVENRIGQYAHPQFAENAISFEPAVEKEAFYFEETGKNTRQLLFYARPETAARNLFEIGVAALRVAVDTGVLSPSNWTFLGMGEKFAPIDLGHGATLECAPWLEFDDYAQMMRQSDILLSLMLSPHPSYPPIEMAACGGLAVTNTFANRDTQCMASLSENIIATSATVETLSRALETAVTRLADMPARQHRSNIALPATWDESFAEVVPALVKRLTEVGLAPDDLDRRLQRVKMPGCLQAGDPFTTFLTAAQKRRATHCAADQVPGLLSFVTTVWNTRPEFMEVLARSVREQIGGTNFEWYLLDNGSTAPDTLEFLEKLRQEPFVRYERVDQNLGIIGGMRYCLERAKGRYILPLDSDDYLFPDTVRTITWYIQKFNHPPLLYTDETLLSGTHLFVPYMKPDWDPVLFVNSCYIAHLGVIDRELAIAYGVYSDSNTEGSHDWDTFTRFHVQGHSPVHIPEVLYAWRIHQQSTAGNIGSKPYVFDSQRSVISRFLTGQPLRERFELQRSPLFGDTPDWWVRRRRIQPRQITTILIRRAGDAAARPDIRISPAIEHQVVEVALEAGLNSLLPIIRQCAEEGQLIHFLSNEAQPDDDEWAWEAIGLMELFPDTVMVGGKAYSHGEYIAAGNFFGFGRGCDCPDRGRPVSDQGYFSQLWKPHSVSAVSAVHAVVEANFLMNAIQACAAWEPSIAHLGVWCGAVARRQNRRVIYSPFVSAETRIDFSVYVTMTEHGRFIAAFDDVMPETRLMSPNLGMAPASAYLPTIRGPFDPAALGVPLPPWFETHINKRQHGAAESAEERTSFAILTTLYSRTDPHLFELTAKSVLAQTYGNFVWHILAHGPITTALEAILRLLERDERVAVIRLPTNLGIIGGMRHVFDACSEEYVVPLDGDDLLTHDCLQILAKGVESRAEPPAYLYTDEDIIIGEHIQSPWTRPKWDPILDLENSWVWHATAFRRDIARAVEVYTDRGVEYCHDWDTLYRFTRAGHEPVHIPQIVYHWRHHPSSTSNSGSSNQGSSASVQHLLKKKIDDRGLSAKYQIAPFPIYRGAEEWWVYRLPGEFPSLRQIVISDDLQGTGASSDLGDQDIRTISCNDRSFESLRAATADLTPDSLVMLISRHVEVTGDYGLPEVIKLFDFHDDLAVVSGRIVTGQTVVGAGLAWTNAGRLVAEYDGMDVQNVGVYGLALKPHCIAVPLLDLCVIRNSFLIDALQELPAGCSFKEFSVWLGALAARDGRRIAFSPLITGEVDGPLLNPRDERIDRICWSAFLQGSGHDARRLPSPGSDHEVVFC